MIQDLISQISQAGGIARPTRFSVQITVPDVMKSITNNTTQAQRDAAAETARLNGTTMQSLGYTPDYFRQLGANGANLPDRLDIMCINAELPGKTYGVTDVRTYGSFFSMPHIDVYSDVTLTFVVGQDMLERNFFDAWSYAIQDPDTSDFNYIEDYGTTMDVYQWDDQDRTTYGVRFFQCWPVTIGQMNLDASRMNSFHTLAITFEYRKWINLLTNSGTPTTIEPSGGTTRGFRDFIVTPNENVK